MGDQVGESSVHVVLFDFGGVLAEKGFEGGLKAIAGRHRLKADYFYNVANHLIHATGYLTGRATEQSYWQAVRNETGIDDNDATLRKEILSRFILRPWMFDFVRILKARGKGVGVLSDQTNWLDELNERHKFFKWFDIIFNSYHLGKSKADPSHFSDTISRLNCAPGRLLFVDDNELHCRTARMMGMHAIRFVDCDSFLKEMAPFYPNDRRSDDAGV